jgi:hypothetical protein
MNLEPASPAWRALAAELAAYCAGLRIQLEQAIPEIRHHLLRVEQAVPAELVREMAALSEPEYPFSLRGPVDVLLRISLPSVVAELTAIATASPEEPFGIQINEEEVWQCLDPTAGEELL